MRILRVLQSQSLLCRCFVGVYETYDGRTLHIIDEPAAGCRESLHQPGYVVSAGMPRVSDASPGLSAQRP